MTRRVWGGELSRSVAFGCYLAAFGCFPNRLPRWLASAKH
jgi:hypothetical protein